MTQTNPQPKPYDLIQKVQQQQHIGPFDAQYASEEIFQEGIKTLLEIAPKLYVSSRPDELDEKQYIYTLWLDTPLFAANSIDDWHINKEIALIQTASDDYYLATPFIKPSSKSLDTRINNVTIYRIK